VIYSRDDGKTAVMFMDPIARFSSIGNPDLEEFGIPSYAKALACA